MINSIVKIVADVLATHQITTTINSSVDDEVYATVEKNNMAFSLFITSEYASVSESRFHYDIGYDEEMIFEVHHYNLKSLIERISLLIAERIEFRRMEDEYYKELSEAEDEDF
jgi:hypothetical protein